MSGGTPIDGERFDVAYLVLSGSTTAARCAELLREAVSPGFWSVTMYDGVTRFTAPNPITRYSLGRDDNLERDADGSLHPLLEGVVEIGAGRRTVQRGRGVAAVVVGSEGIGVGAVAHVLRDLPAREVGEAAGVTGGRDRGDLVGGGGVGIGLGRAAEHPRQAVADPVIGITRGGRKPRSP